MRIKPGVAVNQVAKIGRRQRTALKTLLDHRGKRMWRAKTARKERRE
jgi:hypothetical protein